MDSWFNELACENLDDIIDHRIIEMKKNDASDIQHKASTYVKTEEKINDLRKSKCQTDYFWLTVNTKPGTDIASFVIAIEDCLAQFHWAIWSYEVGKNDNLHCHFLGRVKDYTSNWRRNVNKPFVDICDVKNKHCFKAVWAQPHDTNLKHIVDYIRKIYVSKSKQAGDVNTQALREEYGLQPYYTHGDIPTCLSPTPELILLN